MTINIDKSKLTDGERAFLEDIEKRCAAEGSGEGDPVSPATDPVTTGAAPAAPEGGEGVTKSMVTPAPAAATPATNGTDDPEGIWKGVHPEVRAEMEALRKFREEAENRELMTVAKKYEIIGKKPEELMPVLKSLKAAGGTAYNDMIATLDQAVEVVNKSGIFSEIGKVGHEGEGNTAEQKADAIAKGYMENDPSLPYNQAVAKAWEDHPELIDEYDKQEGF